MRKSIFSAFFLGFLSLSQTWAEASCDDLLNVFFSKYEIRFSAPTMPLPRFNTVLRLSSTDRLRQNAERINEQWAQAVDRSGDVTVRAFKLGLPDGTQPREASLLALNEWQLDLRARERIPGFKPFGQKKTQKSRFAREFVEQAARWIASDAFSNRPEDEASQKAALRQLKYVLRVLKVNPATTTVVLTEQSFEYGTTDIPRRSLTVKVRNILFLNTETLKTVSIFIREAMPHRL